MLLALLNVPADYALSPWPVLSGTAPSTPCCPDGFREIGSFQECRYVYDSLKTVEPMGIFSTTCSGNMAGQSGLRSHSLRGPTRRPVSK